MGDFLLKYSPTKNIQVAGLLATVHVHSAGMLSSFVLNASTAEASLYTRAADSTSLSLRLHSSAFRQSRVILVASRYKHVAAHT